MAVLGHDDTMTTAPQGFTDIDRTHWSLRLLPAALRPYGRLARWDRPIGIWLLLFPGWWAVAMAAPLGTRAECLQFLWLMLAFGLGALAMRGAGCTWNDILDRDVDARVERTRGRPLPMGEATVRQALAWMVLQAAIGAAILLTFNWFAIAVGLASLLVVAIYPAMKRVTSWPQFVLGLAFNWGALLGWVAATGHIAWPALALYVGGIAWTLVYDTIYAMQDRRDDTVIGVRSTARLFVGAPRRWLAIFAVVAMAAFAAAGVLDHAAWPYYAGLLAVGLHLGWQLATLKPDDQPDCLHKFRANRGVGWLLLTGILAARLA